MLVSAILPGMTIELNSPDPLIKELNAAHQTYLITQSEANREKYFTLIKRVHDSFGLKGARALDSSAYAYEAERIAQGETSLTELAKAYRQKLAEFEKQFQSFPFHLRKKMEAFAQAHNRFVQEYNRKFKAENPQWRDRTVRLVAIG